MLFFEFFDVLLLGLGLVVFRAGFEGRLVGVSFDDLGMERAVVAHLDDHVDVGAAGGQMREVAPSALIVDSVDTGAVDEQLFRQQVDIGMRVRAVEIGERAVGERHTQDEGMNSVDRGVDLRQPAGEAGVEQNGIDLESGIAQGGCQHEIDLRTASFALVGGLAGRIAEEVVDVVPLHVGLYGAEDFVEGFALREVPGADGLDLVAEGVVDVEVVVELALGEAFVDILPRGAEVADHGIGQGELREFEGDHRAELVEIPDEGFAFEGGDIDAVGCDFAFVEVVVCPRDGSGDDILAHLDGEIPFQVDVEAEVLGDHHADLCPGCGDAVLEDDGVDRGDEVGVHRVAVLDDGSFADFRD